MSYDLLDVYLWLLFFFLFFLFLQVKHLSMTRWKILLYSLQKTYEDWIYSDDSSAVEEVRVTSICSLCFELLVEGIFYQVRFPYCTRDIVE